MKDDKVALVIVALIVGVLVAYTGVLSDFGIGSSSQVGDEGAIKGTGACPDDMETEVGVAMVNSLMDSDGDEVEISSNADAALYLKGDKQAHSSFTTDTTGYEWDFSGILCDPSGEHEFKVIVGDGSNYYYTETVNGETYMASDNAKEYLKYVLDEVGSLSVTADTQSSMGKSSGSIEKDLSGGETWSDMALNVKENSGAVVRKPTVFIDYNTTAFDDVSIVGAEETDVPTRISGYEKGFKLTDGVEDYSSVSPAPAVKVVASDDLNDAANGANQTVTLTFADEGNYIKEGELKNGYEDQDYDDVGASDVDYTFEID